MEMEGDLTLGDEHTVQYTDDVLQKCIPETYIILLTNVTPKILIKTNKRRIKKERKFMKKTPQLKYQR